MLGKKHYNNIISTYELVLVINHEITSPSVAFFNGALNLQQNTWKDNSVFGNIKSYYRKAVD